MQEEVKPPIHNATDDRRLASDAEDVLPVTTIKKEPTSGDEIKEYAENAMNELLGCWYGYEKNDKELLRRRANSGGESSDSESPKYSEGNTTCGWCSRHLPKTPPLSSWGGSFCSELCFSQLRRATFKRSRTCDWCRRVRHTVCHADIREQGRTLQFCSARCLNQYKMHVFCRETQAHLELHPHAPTADNGGVLITPELWFKDCNAEEEQTAIPLRGTELITTRVEPEPEGRDRRRVQQRKGRSCNKRRSCSTVTSADELPVQFPPASDSPQDLRVRPRDEQDQTKPTTPSLASHHPYPLRIPPIFDRPRQAPPITVLVPYPIIIPLPLPIPIPIPISNIPDIFLKMAEKLKTEENQELDLSKTSEEKNKTLLETILDDLSKSSKLEDTIKEKDVNTLKNNLNLPKMNLLKRTLESSNGSIRSLNLSKIGDDASEISEVVKNLKKRKRTCDCVKKNKNTVPA